MWYSKMREGRSATNRDRRMSFMAKPNARRTRKTVFCWLGAHCTFARPENSVTKRQSLPRLEEHLHWLTRSAALKGRQRMRVPHRQCQNAEGILQKSF